MRKQIARSWPFLVGTILILAALFLFLFNVRENREAEKQVEIVLEKIHEITPAAEMPRNEREPGDPLEMPTMAETDPYIPDYLLNPNMEMPTVEVAGDDYIGTLSFPALQLELPVMPTWSYTNLKTAPCLYAGSIYTGDAVIAAHNYPSHFGQLSSLSPGDAVYFTDVDGNVFTYEVILQEILEPTAIEDMTSSSYDLSLFTCTLGGQSRFTVRCNRR